MVRIKTIIVVCILFTISLSMDSKTLFHIISIPVIDGAGIYSSVRCLQTDNTNNKASAITNLSLLGLNAGLGILSMVNQSDSYRKLRTTHRVIGFLLSGAAVWLTVSMALDEDIARIDKGMASGYTALTAIPLVLFSF